MVPNGYSLKYRTFDELYEDVTVDLKNFALEGLIEPQTLIKVARRCNYELGFRIYRTRQAVLEVEKGKVRLPDDFHILNFAFVCGEYEITEALPQGTHIEERLIEPPTYTPWPENVDPCNADPDPCDQPDPCTGTCLTRCGDEYQLVQKIHTTTRTWKTFFQLHLTQGAKIECDCPNIGWKGCANQGKIENGFLKVNFEHGKVYINYQGDMIDDEGNLMVPDHELFNEFYEYALKQRILENLVMNGENVGERFGIVEGRYRAARNNAMSVVNMPNFAELRKLWQVNRKAQYSKYYDMFKSWNPHTTRPYGHTRNGYNGHGLF
jgi:hypothetical protein